MKITFDPTNREERDNVLRILHTIGGASGRAGFLEEKRVSLAPTPYPAEPEAEPKAAPKAAPKAPESLASTPHEDMNEEELRQKLGDEAKRLGLIKRLGKTMTVADLRAMIRKAEGLDPTASDLAANTDFDDDDETGAGEPDTSFDDDTEAPEEPDEEPDEEPAEELTADDLRTYIRQLAGEHGDDAVDYAAEVKSGYAVKNVGELTPAQLGEFISKLKKWEATRA